ncbi:MULTISPECIES: DUF721 domain-containing protein [Flavobacterium]|uniref:RNA-binding protein n=2 Tax=Flavobacterium TaxID=237 RepID=A0A0A2LNV7_9FLAO|nr:MULTISPECIES: DUF721 domain-containing protein [Flavobacterium]KGO81967.1 RNA-binding protein [Flavobacterium beibuense F44-8]MEE1898902.1 DUF721 domain-containing protein [Flavobacterium rakeshii]MUV04090.1 DUF721 domain-containing protein [Flavobacterium rakeshii]
MAKRLNDYSSVSDVLKQFVESNNLQKGIDKIDVRDAWKNLMGNGVNNYTREIMLKGTTLYVELTSAVLREELSYGKEKIVKMINEEMGREVIKEVILR